MARCVANVALFMDTVPDWCLLAPLTYDAPATGRAASPSTPTSTASFQSTARPAGSVRARYAVKPAII